MGEPVFNELFQSNPVDFASMDATISFVKIAKIHKESYPKIKGKLLKVSEAIKKYRCSYTELKQFDLTRRMEK